ncbi:MAG: NAD-binding protein [Candidatus Helarchaeota archaeon]|nr:NAD-binding protein [Candidatus Helarchaeota archaeon]
MWKKLTKIKIILRQNVIGISVIILWFLIHFIAFLITTGGNSSLALAYTFYFEEILNGYGNFYPIITEFIIFGWIFMLITVEVYRKYHPEQTCLALSRSMRNHAVIIGYSHFGQRIKEYLDQKNKHSVVIEDDEQLARELIEAEEPIVPKKPLDKEILDDANIKDAKLILNTKDDLESLVVATDLIREVNKTCKIICRCYDDSLAKILEKQLGCDTISTSRYACQVVFTEIEKGKVENLVIIGCNHTARRLMKKLKANDINYKVIERDKKRVEDIIDEEPIIIGDAKDLDILKEAGVPTAELVVTLMDASGEVLIIVDQIRELNKNCHLMCRFFHEEVAELLEKPPFNAYVISTSKNTLNKLIESGIFDKL